MKKIISILLACIMLLCLLPGTAAATNVGDTATFQDNGFTLRFYSQGDGWCLSSVSGSGDTLTIPAAVDGEPVLGVDVIYSDSLTGPRTLIIPEGVRWINDGLYGLYDLTTLYLPSTLEEIGWNNYEYLTSLTDVYYAGSPARLQAIIDGKNSSDYNSGKSTPNLTYWNRAQIHYGLTNEDALYTISQRQNASDTDKGTVTLSRTSAPAGETVSLAVKPLDGYAVVSVSLYSSDVGDVGYTWSSRANTASFVMPNGHVLYQVLYMKDEHPNTAGDACYRIPGGILSFDRSTGTITSFQVEGDGVVTLPRTIDGVPVKKIGPRAFMDCAGLKKVIIPSSIETIGDSAFFRCEDLEDVQIEDGKLNIEQWAFSNCINLKTLRLPVGLNSLRDAPFTHCFSLKTLIIPEGTKSLICSLPEGIENLYLPVSLKAYSLGFISRVSDLYYAGTRQQLDDAGPNNREITFPTAWSPETRIHCNNPIPTQPSPVVSDVTAVPVTETTAQPTTPHAFTDVPASAWYASSVADVQQYGIIQGVGNGRFSPNSTLSLAQAITMAARTYAYTNGLTITDNGAGDWYEPYLLFAAEHRICDRDEFGTDYNAPCSRLVMAQLFCRVFPQNTANQLNDVTVLPDVANTPANQSVFFLYRQGVLVGNDKKGTFTPNASITRAQTATILVRVLDSSKREHIELPAA